MVWIIDHEQESIPKIAGSVLDKLMTHKFTCIWALTGSYFQTEQTETFGMMLGKSYVSNSNIMLHEKTCEID